MPGVARGLFVLAVTILLLSGAEKSNARKFSLGTEYESEETYQRQEVLGGEHQDLRRLAQTDLAPVDSLVCAHCRPRRQCRELSWCSNSTASSDDTD